MTASEFKAKCLAILDEVAETGEPVTITKRGRPTALLSPAIAATEGYPQATLFGTVEVVGDIIEPVLPADSWGAERGELL